MPHRPMDWEGRAQEGSGLRDLRSKPNTWFFPGSVFSFPAWEVGMTGSLPQRCSLKRENSYTPWKRPFPAL